MNASTHHFLMLQGLRSPFFLRLAQGLRAAGARVTKLHFTLGDHLYWRGSAQSCHKPEAALAAHYEQLLASGSFTDLVLFGDCRPVHQPAIAQARALGIPVHVFEEGYFRPDWVTLERAGVNGYSDLPRDPNWYRKVQSHVPASEPTTEVGPAMSARILHDIAYNAGNLLNPLFYRHYQSHVPHSILAEYLSYARRFVQVRAKRARDQRGVEQLCASPAPPFYLVALQVAGDSQLTVHSRFKSSEDFLHEVFDSFVGHASRDAWLVIKNHPLDPGLQRHDRLVARLANEYGCAARVVFLDSGNLPQLLDNACGLVTVNSTSIGQAMFHRCPTIAMGSSIFAMPGLTFDGSLDAFWGAAKQTHARPDAALFRAFSRVVRWATQINGGLYTERGIGLAVQNAVPNLLAPEGKLQALLRQFPCERES